MTRRSPVGALEHARIGIRRAAVRRQLQAVAAGGRRDISLALDEKGVDVVGVLDQVVRSWRPESPPMQRLRSSFAGAGITVSTVDELSARSVGARKTSVRFLGAMHIESAVPWIAPLLRSGDRALFESAARSLGRIGGLRSAAALLNAVHRTGMRRILITELARAAPDLFLETALSEALRPGLVQAAAIAAGLRRRRTALGPLLALLRHGTRRERAIACRSLGWIGDASATATLIGALDDEEWRVRMSAARALGTLRAELAAPNLEKLTGDRNPRVRKAAESALRRTGTTATAELV